MRLAGTASPLSSHCQGTPKPLLSDRTTARPQPSRHHVPPLPCTAHLQHIDTGSPKPLLDVITYGFVFSYAYSWPRE